MSNLTFAKKLSRLATSLTETASIVSGSAFETSVTAVGGAGVTVYTTVNDLPVSGNTAGDQAFVDSDNRLYIYSGEGWYNIGLINTSPSITSGGAGSYTLATDGTATVITLVASDPEGIPITWSYSATGLDSEATIAQGTGDSANIFTITPNTDNTKGGTFSVTFTASDGINIATDVNSFSLTFLAAEWPDSILSTAASSSFTTNDVVDRSGNGQTITLTNAPFIDTENPWGDTWSVYMRKITGDVGGLRIPHHSSQNLTGDFTIEWWMNIESGSASAESIFDKGWQGVAYGEFLFYWNGANYLFYSSSNGSSWDVASGFNSGFSATYDKWIHYAITRDSGRFRFFEDGVLKGTFTNAASSNSLTQSGDPIDIHCNGIANAYFSNFRWVTGTVVYSTSETTTSTAVFTPPTAPLTAITGTAALVCQDRYYKDNSPNNLTIAPGDGNQRVNVSRYTPFGNQEYTSGDYKGSVQFNNSNEYYSASLGTSIGNTWTIEFWFKNEQSYAATANHYIFDFRTGGTLYMYAPSASSASAYWQTPLAAGMELDTLPSNTGHVYDGAWHHIVFCHDYSGTGNYRFWVDGESTTTGAASASLTLGTTVYVNARYSSQYPTKCKIADLKISPSALYNTANTSITVPTTGVGPTNSRLYVPGDNHAIYDKSGKLGNLLIAGNTTPSTTQTKYASRSIYFDGTGDYLYTTEDLDWPNRLTSNGDFTIECWVYPQNTSAATAGIFTLTGSSSSGSNGLIIWYQSGYLKFTVSGNANGSSSTGTYSNNQWYHIALVRSGSTNTLYVDGSSVCSNTNTPTWPGTAVLGIGRAYSDNTGYSLQGYIENLQIFTQAKYTGTFTPPSATQTRLYQASS